MVKADTDHLLHCRCGFYSLKALVGCLKTDDPTELTESRFVTFGKWTRVVSGLISFDEQKIQEILVKQ